MLRVLFRSACVLWLLWSAQALLRGQEATVTWRGEVRALDALGADAVTALPTVKAWLPFASDTKCRLVLSDDARVLLVLCVAYERRLPKKEHHDVEMLLDLVRNTCVVTDRVLAPLPGSAPLVVVGIRTADYPKLLAQLVKVDPRLQAWAGGAGQTVNGFILSDPLVAAWIDDPAGVDEWYPYNECIHRTAELLIRRRAPQLPGWFLLGLGWHVEDTVLSCIYCFPHRAGFVSQAEHTDWGLCLANNFKPSRRKKDNKPPHLGMEEFAGWSPGSGGDEFSTGQAYTAFGVARYLAHEHTSKLLPLAEKFNAAIEKGSKVWTSATDWTTVPDYKIPIAEQLAMLNAVEGDLLVKVTDYFQKKKANERRSVAKKK